MRVRWAVAAVSALALALLTLDVDMPWTFSDLEATSGATACPADAKPANYNFTLKDINNKAVKLDDLKGKVVLLDFWATWCLPCKMEIPWFIEFQQKYGAQGFQAVGISVDDTLDKLTPYVHQMKMNYSVLQGLGHDDVQEAFGPIWALPVTLVISRDGKICAKHTGIGPKALFENAIKALL